MKWLFNVFFVLKRLFLHSTLNSLFFACFAVQQKNFLVSRLLIWPELKDICIKNYQNVFYTKFYFYANLLVKNLKLFLNFLCEFNHRLGNGSTFQKILKTPKNSPGVKNCSGFSQHYSSIFYLFQRFMSLQALFIDFFSQDTQWKYQHFPS